MPTADKRYLAQNTPLRNLRKSRMVIHVEQPAHSGSYPIVISASSREKAEAIVERLKESHGLHVGSNIKVVVGYEMREVSWVQRLEE